jgi:hypothetical protein
MGSVSAETRIRAFDGAANAPNNAHQPASPPGGCTARVPRFSRRFQPALPGFTFCCRFRFTLSFCRSDSHYTCLGSSLVIRTPRTDAEVVRHPCGTSGGLTWRPPGVFGSGILRPS